ncbi:MAG: iron-containing alcohol dehydrogenase [Bauldia sp.]|nr:iron-containing alcohol dehydrogenase [Bauldia sp.]
MNPFAGIAPFSLSRLPRIILGAGTVRQLPETARAFGTKALLVTGTRSLRMSAHWAPLTAGLREASIAWEELAVSGEPSPQLVDGAVWALHDRAIEVVIGIGGGSVLDAAKAIAGLLRPGNSVMDHLEGVGPELPYRGPAVPFIAVPTTAGTGSEATKNAVLSVHGADGFKKSFRDDRLVAEYAIVDPDLLAGCPPELIAADGMDALTQLLESLVSTRASPFTDALALSGLAAVRDSLAPWFEGRGDVAAAQSGMAYAALLSGITLAQAGLGAVHGLAAPMGAFFDIPHGVVCGTLVADTTRANIAALTARVPQSMALAKYATAGRVLADDDRLGDAAARDALVATLDTLTARLALPRLAAYGIGEDDIDRIVAASGGSSMKTNPIVLTAPELATILRARI